MSEAVEFQVEFQTAIDNDTYTLTTALKTPSVPRKWDHVIIDEDGGWGETVHDVYWSIDRGLATVQLGHNGRVYDHSNEGLAELLLKKGWAKL